MTKQEQEVVVETQRRAPVGASSPEECEEIFETAGKCDVILTAERITRPEWDELFPRVKFYLVKYDVYENTYPRNPPFRRSALIIKEWGDYLSREDFNLMLDWDQITVTDENRELVARTFVLMSLPDYLDEEIVFSGWEEGSWPSDINKPYNYAITSWTKIQGLKIQWLFIFHEGNLLTAWGEVIEHNVGDYIDVPFEELPPPLYTTLEYWRKKQ